MPHGPVYIIKLFTAVIVDKLECFPLSVTSNLVFYLWARLEVARVDPPMERNSED
jgi:hypothetical protein